MRAFARILGTVVAAVAGFPHAVRAQVSLTLAQTPNVFPAPAVADYNAGLIANPTGIVYTVDVTGGSATTTRTSIVSIRSSSASLGGGKVLSDLQWRRADLATWNAMTTSNVTVETRQVRRNNLNDPWSNTLFLRMLLSWTTDAPATYSAGLVFTLTITTP
jgi:hypothetical protein